MSILELTAVELGKKIKDKEITVVEATKAALEQIKAYIPRTRQASAQSIPVTARLLWKYLWWYWWI